MKNMDISFEMEQGTNLSTVIMDPTRLVQILLTLCVNARDAIPDSGKITIEIRRNIF